MAFFYPRAQTFVIALISILVVGGVFLYVHRGQSSVSYNFGNSGNSNNENVAIASAGNDQTNSTDWQKQFAGTNKNFAVPTQNGAKPATTDQPLTFTDEFGRNFFTKYMQLKQGNLESDDTAVKTVVDQTMNDFIGSAPQPKSYTYKDITISTQTSEADQRAYANNIGTIFSMYIPRENAAIIAGDALDKKDETEIKKVDVIVTGYSTVLAKLLKLPVPQALSTYHLGIVNGISAMLFVSEGMKQVFSDPAQGLIALGMYGTAQDTLRQPLIGLNGYLKSQGISFTSNEPAIVLSTIE